MMQCLYIESSTNTSCIRIYIYTRICARYIFKHVRKYNRRRTRLVILASNASVSLPCPPKPAGRTGYPKSRSRKSTILTHVGNTCLSTLRPSGPRKAPSAHVVPFDPNASIGCRKINYDNSPSPQIRDWHATMERALPSRAIPEYMFIHTVRRQTIRSDYAGIRSL